MPQSTTQDTSEIVNPDASRQDHLPPSRRRRAGHRKSRAGCNNCKQRHLKCDEEKPTCIRCQRAGELCQWRSAPRSGFRKFKIETTRTMRVAALDSAAAVDAFEFFDLYTLPILRECHPSVLWRSAFGFLAQSSAALRKIAIALGFQHRGLDCGAGVVRAQTLAKADISYTQALHSLRLSLGQSDHALTIAFGCMLLVLLSSLRDDRSDFLVHLACGLDILKKMDHRTKMSEEVRGVNAILQHYCTNSWLYSFSPLFGGRAGHFMETLQLDGGSYPDAQALEVPSLELSSLAAGLMHVCHSSGAADGNARRRTQLQQLWCRANALEDALENVRDERHVSATSLAVSKATLVVLKDSFGVIAEFNGGSLELSAETSMKALDHVETATNELSRIGRAGRAGKDDDGQAQLFSIDLGILQLLDIVATASNNAAVHDRALSLSERCPKVEGLWVASKTRQAIQEKISKRVLQVEG